MARPRKEPEEGAVDLDFDESVVISKSNSDDTSRMRKPNVRETMHQAREVDVRDNQEMRPDTEFRDMERGNGLTAPPPRAGYAQRWVNAGATPSDHNMWHSRMMDGWEPRSLTTIDDRFKNKYAPPGQTTVAGDFLFARGMILCEIPLEKLDRMVAADEKRTRDIARSQIADLARVVKDHKSYVVEDDNSSVSVGRGRRPATMA